MIDGGPLESLFEAPSLSAFALPSALVADYGGPLGFATPVVVANFVASVDGVVALAQAAESGHIISRSSAADRFVMGMLRATADFLVVGAGTFRKARGHRFDARGIYPEAGADFDEARRQLGLGPAPTLVVVTASGAIDTGEASLEGALVVTTRTGEAALRGRVSKSTRVVVLGHGERAPGEQDAPHTEACRVADVIALLRGEGARVILTEGGPTLFGEMVAARVVDELFVTTSPVLFGRYPGDQRKNLTDHADLGGVALELMSLRRQGSYLFSRFRLSASA
jgi:riboflavin biosynthesis pyrimidine reductase